MYNARKEPSYQCSIMQKAANNYAYLVNHFFFVRTHTHTHTNTDTHAHEHEQHQVHN